MSTSYMKRLFMRNELQKYNQIEGFHDDPAHQSQVQNEEEREAEDGAIQQVSSCWRLKHDGKMRVHRKPFIK